MVRAVEVVSRCWSSIYGRLWLSQYNRWWLASSEVLIVSSQVFGHLRSFKGWIQTEACVIPSYHGMLIPWQKHRNSKTISIAVVPSRDNPGWNYQYNPSLSIIMCICSDRLNKFSMGDMSGEYAGHARTGMFSPSRNCVQILATWGRALSCCNMRWWSWMNGTTMGLRTSSRYMCI